MSKSKRKKIKGEINKICPSLTKGKNTIKQKKNQYVYMYSSNFGEQFFQKRKIPTLYPSIGKQHKKKEKSIKL